MPQRVQDRAAALCQLQAKQQLAVQADHFARQQLKTGGLTSLGEGAGSYSVAPEKHIDFHKEDLRVWRATAAAWRDRCRNASGQVLQTEAVVLNEPEHIRDKGAAMRKPIAAVPPLLPKEQRPRSSGFRRLERWVGNFEDEAAKPLKDPDEEIGELMAQHRKAEADRKSAPVVQLTGGRRRGAW